MVRIVAMRESAREEVRRLAEEAQKALSEGVDQTRAWLGSENGRRFRQITARVLLVTAPLLFRHRFFRSTWPGRIIELAGGAALLIKLAEAIRDWEPEPTF